MPYTIAPWNSARDIEGRLYKRLERCRPKCPKVASIARRFLLKMLGRLLRLLAILEKQKELWRRETIRNNGALSICLTYMQALESTRFPGFYMAIPANLGGIVLPLRATPGLFVFPLRATPGWIHLMEKIKTTYYKIGTEFLSLKITDKSRFRGIWSIQAWGIQPWSQIFNILRTGGVINV